MTNFSLTTASRRRGMGRCLGLLGGLLAAAPAAFAQTPTGSVGIGTTAPDVSAALDVSSATRGFLPPRLSQAQRDAIASPAVGLTLFNTTTNKLNTWNGTSWDATLSTTEQPFQPPTQTYTYTGTAQTYTVPAGVRSLTVTATGAAGADSRTTRANYAGGLGAQVQATLAVTPGETLTLYVGGAGSLAPIGRGGGGYNGGGDGGNRGGNQGGGGGGGSDVRRSATAPSTSLADRLLVAAGGGGGGYYGYGGYGGAPDGATGGTTTGSGAYPGTGATQTSGGSYYGALGQGGFDVTNAPSGGGGGGYYGGGGSNSYGGGGGGSSWARPTGSSGITLTANVQAGNGSISITAVAYAAPVLDGRNFLNVPGDNLGNHTATQNLDLGSYQLVGNGGSSGLSIGSTGNVGFGTPSPAYKLDVAGSTNVTGSSYVGGSTSVTGNTTVGGNASVGGNTTVAGSSNLAGNVGIGTTAQPTKLYVQAADNSTSPIATFQPQNQTQGVSLTYQGIAKTGTNTSSTLTLDGKGTGDILLHTTGSIGNVGIGTTSPPTQKLDVAGNVRLGAANTVGKVITNTTGNNNMLAVAYGQTGNGNTNVFGGSGNFSVAVTSPGVYTITFPASSGLSGVFGDNFSVNVSLYGSTPGFVTYTHNTGTITVSTFTTNGTLSSNYYFSFSVFTP